MWMMTSLMKAQRAQKLKFIQQRDNVKQNYTGFSENIYDLSLFRIRKPKQASNSRRDSDV